MRQYAVWIACLIGSPLLGETARNITFDFPPSTHEWRLLTDIDDTDMFDDEDEDFGAEDPDKSSLTIYTHREGDALETFCVIIDDSRDEDDEEEMTTSRLQEFINETFGQYLPNHKIALNSIVESDTDSLREWEINDGTQDLVHGYSRTSVVGDTTIILNYTTTALKTEMNRSLWINVLSQAHFIE